MHGILTRFLKDMFLLLKDFLEILWLTAILESR